MRFNRACNIGDRIWVCDVRPQHHRTVTAIGRYFRPRLHGDRGRLIHRVRVIKHPALNVRTALPITPNQHITTAGGAVSVNRTAGGQRNVITFQDNSPAALNQAGGIQLTRVPNNPTQHRVLRAAGQDNLPPGRTHGVAAFDQRINQRRLDPNTR